MTGSSAALRLALVGLAAFTSLHEAYADEGAPAPPRTTSVVVYGMDGQIVAKEVADLSAAGPTAWAERIMTDLYNAGKLEWTSANLGPKRVKVVMSIAGHRGDFAKGIGWILSVLRADGSVEPNVALGDVILQPGDTLEWRLMRISEAPKPKPKATAGRAEEDEDEEEL